MSAQAMNATDPAPVVAFDFDGTLTRADSLVPFLRSLVGIRRTAVALIAAQWAWRPRNEEGRDRAKRTLIRNTTRGLLHSEVVAAGERFAAEWLESRVRRDVVQPLGAHRWAQDRLVLVSASLDVYLEPIAALLGIGEVICCRLAADASGVCTGEIIGENPRGPVKAALLRELLEPGTTLAYGYGNDPVGDGPMLAMADHAVLVPRWGQLGGRLTSRQSSRRGES